MTDVESLRDVVAEVDSALLFVGLGLAVRAEPLGEKGPDLEIRRAEHSLLVEVSRLRLKREMPVFDQAQLPLMLAELGPPLEDVRRAFQEICDKLPQLASQPGILLIWDDDEVLDEAHVATAAMWLREHFDSGNLQYREHLQFVALHVDWVRPADPQEFFTWSLREPQDARIAAWRVALESVRLRDAVHAACSHLLSS